MREVNRIRIRRFLGLGLAGEAVSQPVRQISTRQFASFLEVAQNVHAPLGRLTNTNVGYNAQATAPAAGDWLYLGWLADRSGLQSLFGILDTGAFYDQGGLTGTWTSKKTGLDVTERYDGVEYGDLALMANGEETLAWDGTTVLDWVIPAPAVAATMSNSGTSTFSGGEQYKYIFCFRRSGDDPEPRSPRSPLNTVYHVTELNLAVQVQGYGTDSAGVDKIDIYRTTDEGATYAFLAEIDSVSAATQWTYEDDTLDSNISQIECPTFNALSDIVFRSCATYGDRVYVIGLEVDGVFYRRRVRWSYPGQPWRFDLDDYTDEIDQETIAISAVDGGVMVMTPENAYFLRHIGGRSHTAKRLDYPGGVGTHARVSGSGAMGWIGERTIHFVSTDTQNVQEIADPAGIASSIAPRLFGVGTLNNSWMLWDSSRRYLIVALSFAGTTPSALLLYDADRKQWFETTYGGTFAVVVPDSGVDGGNKIILGLTDGDTVSILDGNTADGAALVPYVGIGRTDLTVSVDKIIREIVFGFNAIRTGEYKIGYKDPESGANKSRQIVLDVDTTLLGDRSVPDADDFQLDVDEIGLTSSGEYAVEEVSVLDEAGYLEIYFTEETGLGEFELYYVDVPIQRIEP